MPAPTHHRLRQAIGRYADGELNRAKARALASHLSECDDCSRELAMVRAIKGSLRRLADAEPPALAATRLRRGTATLHRIDGVPPLRLQDCGRIAAVSAREGSGGVRPLIRPAARRRVHRLAAVAVAVGVAAALWAHQTGPSPSPGTVAALVELARLDSPEPAARDAEGRQPLQGHTLPLGDQTVSLVRRMVDGRDVFIAISGRAFAMPADGRRVGQEADAPWLAKRGGLSVACLSEPMNILLVGALSPDRLLEVGRQLEPGES
jgi:anti-sigma factor RsiW